MIRLFLLLLLSAGPLFGQAGLYIDLAGDWRHSIDDSPEMASAAYDDSAWRTMRLPLKDARDLPGGSGWLRRKVELPAWADRTQLALTLGPFRGVYAVYVNGQEIARVGSFETGSAMQVSRTRTFAIPAPATGPGQGLPVAIRYGRPLGGGFLPRLDQNAPYLLTYRAQAPVTAGVDSLRIRRAQFTPALVIAAIYLVFSVVVLLAWLGDRQRRELSWLAVFLGVSSFHGVWTVMMIGPDATPFNHYGVPSFSVITLMATWTLFASFVVAASGLRANWLYGILWSCWCVAATILAGPGGIRVFVAMGTVCGLVAVGVIAVAWWRLIRERGPLNRHFLFAVLAIPAMHRLELSVSGSVESFLQFGDYYLSRQDFFALLLTCVILALLLRQVVMDRRDRQRLQGEMEAARSAQLFLLGRGAAIHTVAFEIDPVYEPALEVGGDFHWTRGEPDGSLIAVVGDVSGKGLKAAMLVSVAIGILRNEKSSSPAAILGALNEGLVGHTDGGFVTCCCARFAMDGTTTIANAGHLLPYCDDGEVMLEGGLPLGVAEGVAYAETTMQGARFTFVSDGVVEAANAKGELFGFERTRAASGKAAREIAEAAKEWGQNDDITVVTVQRVA